MREHRVAAFFDTLFVVVLSTLPLLGRLIQIFFSDGDASFDSLFKSGEFFLFSIGLLSSSYLVFNHFKIKKSDWNSRLSICTLLMMVITTFCYNMLSSTNLPNLNRVKLLSIIIFIMSIIAFYYSQIINSRNTPDIGAQRQGEQEVIENALN